MLVLRRYAVAVVFCVITMLCWGSWTNTLELVSPPPAWRFELFYWDYVFGILLMALVFAFTLGSAGTSGRNFWSDLKQGKLQSLVSALLGGVIFNAANILLVSAVDIAGMSVAFPVGIGLALALGVAVNYWATPKGDPVPLFVGVGLIVAAVVLTALAYGTMPEKAPGETTKGLVLALVGGFLMGYFYRFVARAMSPDFDNMEPGKLSPYTAVIVFSLGILLSNFVFNTALMMHPFKGEPVAIAAYFQGTGSDHLLGVVGGMIWAVGMTFSIIASGKAGFAISYGLGQGATLVAAFCGVFIWRDFREAPPSTNWLIGLMFVGYLLGLALIIRAGRSTK